MMTSTIIFTFLLFPLVHTVIEYTISENSGRNHRIGNVLTKSNLREHYDTSVIHALQYSLMSRGSLPTDYFRINNRTSEIFVAKPIDRDNLCDLLMICCEEVCRIPLSVVAQPITGKFFIRTIKLQVMIRDENDNSPTFQSRTIEGHVSELASQGSVVLLTGGGNPLIATDRDVGKNSVQEYSLISSTETFELDVTRDFDVITDVAIVTRKSLDREKLGFYKVTVIAIDHGKPRRSGSVTVDIIVDDFNDHSPTFVNDSYQVTVSESIALNSFVLKVQAVDLDAGPNADIQYSIKNIPSDSVSRLFTINSLTGEIRTKGRLNFEQQSAYRILVEAKDKGFNLQRMSKTTVTVQVEDVNDRGPVIKHGYLNVIDRAEVIESAPLDTFVAFFMVTDPDQDGINCVINSPMFRLRRSESDNNEYHLLTAHPLNRELSDKYDVTITCSDDGSPELITSETFTVYVLDDNDNSPHFTRSTYTATVKENNEFDAFVVQVEANDMDIGENGRVIYSLNREGEGLFSINSLNGKIYAKRIFDREHSARILFQALVRDNGTQPYYAQTTVIIDILDENDNAPVFHNVNRFEISEDAGSGVMLGQMSALDPDLGLNAEVSFDMIQNTDSRMFSISNSGLITTLGQLDRELQMHYHLIIVARDHGKEVQHSSSTTVTILVTDINDNPPVIWFPSAYNNTIYISYLEPSGNVIGYINASDQDLGRNGLLQYSISNGNEQRLFNMDKSTGAIKVAKPMKIQDAIVHKLSIRVVDQSEPFNRETAVLNIVVDGTGKAISSDGHYVNTSVSNRNLIIVICLAVVSAVLAVILVVSIICICKTTRTQSQYIQPETGKVDQQTHRTLPDIKYQPAAQESNDQEHYQYDHINGNHTPVYSSLRAQNWKSSVYPKPQSLGTKV